MPPQIYSNHLSVYLIKQDISNPEEILKNFENLQSEVIADNVGTLYFGNSHVYEPDWLGKFFGNSFSNTVRGTGDDQNLKIFSASAKAAFLVKVEGRTFAITFGYGRTMLAPGVWEERFGLKVLLNIIDSKHIRSIDKKSMTTIPKLSKEQIAKSSAIADFGIDVEQDLVQGITAISKVEAFGKAPTGKDALSVSTKVDLTNIKDFLKLCYRKYKSKDYEAEFKWIDHIAEIADPMKIEVLEEKLLSKIQTNDFEKVWMAIPAIVPWEDVKNFEISNNSYDLGDDLHIVNFLDALSNAEKANLDLALFKKKIIDCNSATSEQLIDSWKAFDCLCAEIDDDDQTYVLSNGKWYEIEANFAKKVNRDFVRIRDAGSIELPDCKLGEHEDKYNERVESEVSTVCNMDRKTVVHGATGNSIEFCDLLTKDKQIIHVKHYGSSSVLSHLFAQGLVSAELFVTDEEFREKVRGKVRNSHKPLVTTTKPNASDYTIVYAIISKSDSEFNIPFFSKVNLRNAVRRLDAFGFKKVIVQKVKTDRSSAV